MQFLSLKQRKVSGGDLLIEKILSELQNLSMLVV
jgi:hypothetical protein